mmetsp:Transcript_110001/g.206189  ORF Transcript_110001/g.206189 Transcript_110001/m.206189 type:complete len:81 (-) Transcript_110001:1069-1311(-)
MLGVRVHVNAQKVPGWKFGLENFSLGRKADEKKKLKSDYKPRSYKIDKDQSTCTKNLLGSTMCMCQCERVPISCLFGLHD